MTADLILALLIALAGPGGPPPGADCERFADAIAATDATPDEARVLASLAFTETRCKPVGSDGTPAYGLSDYWERHGHVYPTIEQGAPISLRFLRLHVAQAGTIRGGLARYFGRNRRGTDAYVRVVMRRAAVRIAEGGR